MTPNKNRIVFLALTVKICFAGIAVKTTKPIVSSELIDATVDILTSCYAEHGPIGISGSVPQTLLTKLWSKKQIPVILVNSNKRMREEPYIPRGNLRVFLLIAATVPESLDALSDIANSHLYCHRSSILVLRSVPNIKADGCENAHWLFMNLRINAAYNANLICVNDEKKITLFSFNPHMEWAPQPWNFLGFAMSDNDKFFSFYLFERQYKRGNDTCINLDYDRTRDLGGGNMTLHSQVPDFWVQPSNMEVRNRIEIETSKYVNMWQIVFRQLNATPQPLKYGTSSQMGVYMGLVPVRSYPTFHAVIQPVVESKNRILTQFRGNKSQLTKILTIVDIYSRCCVGVALFVTLLFFKFVAHQHFIPGMLNVFRMICNTGFTNVPSNLTSRTYLACLFLFVVTIHGIFAGKLASLLTTKVPLQHAHTIEDLIELNYTIYVTKSLFDLLTNVKYDARIIWIRKVGECILVARDPTAACIENKNYLMELAGNNNLHISDHDIFVTYQTFGTVSDPPYTDRLNEIFLRIFEADLLHSFPSRVKEIRLDEHRHFVEKQVPTPRVMSFKDLDFAFIILSIGLGCAIVSFIIEISLNPALSRIAKVRRFFRRRR